MIEKTFKINLWNLWGEWIALLFTVSLISFLLYADNPTASDFPIKIGFYIFLMLIFWGPFFHLFFNHLFKSLGAQLKVMPGYIAFSQNGLNQTIKMEDIKEILIQSNNGNQQYGRSLPWTEIFICKIKSDDAEIIVSSIIVSKSNLKKIFKNEFTYEKVFFPML